MEIDITDFFNQAAPMDYSASVAEIGADAGQSTWQAACDDAPDYAMLKTEDQLEAFKAHMQDMGFSEAGDFAAWSTEELNALFIQMVSGDMREVPGVDMGPDMTEDDWCEYQRLAERGTVSGLIYRGNDGQIYYYVGN